MLVVYEAMRVPLTFRAAAILGVAMVVPLGGCGDSSSACGVPVREELDPNSLLHVIDPTVAKYKSDPPTSGAHLSTPGPGGLVTAPMLPALQVTVLERGDVLVQYRDDADRAPLAPLVGNGVVVAPQPSLPERVVVTAWTYKLICRSIDTTAISKFVGDHAGKPREH